MTIYKEKVIVLSQKKTLEELLTKVVNKVLDARERKKTKTIRQ